MHRIYRVVAGDPGLDDEAFFAELDRAISELGPLGYFFEIESDETFRDESAQVVWAEIEERINISAIRAKEGFTYLVVTAGKLRYLRHVEAALDPRIEFETLEELQERAEHDLMWKPVTLVKVALAANDKPDGMSLSLIRRGLKHQNPNTRYHAALAAGHARWAELVDDLGRVLKGEAVDRVRDIAERAHAACLERRQSRVASRSG